MKFKLLMGIAVLVFTLSPAHANSYVYDVNFAIGSDTVTGEITTDINSGYLTSSDITSWSFLLDNSNGFSSTGSNPVTVIGSEFIECDVNVAGVRGERKQRDTVL